MKVLLDKLKRYYRQICMIVIRDGWKKVKWMKKQNMFHYIGEHCYYCSNLLPAEPFLVCLHDNVIVSTGVRFITHSVANVVFNYEEKTKDYRCRYGKIEIHDNVYIGADAIINFGVTIGENCIIAAGGVVTKDVEPGSVMAGIPARKIGNYEDVKKKTLEFSRAIGDVGEDKSVANLIKRAPVVFDIDRKADLDYGEKKRS